MEMKLVPSNPRYCNHCNLFRESSSATVPAKYVLQLWVKVKASELVNFILFAFFRYWILSYRLQAKTNIYIQEKCFVNGEPLSNNLNKRVIFDSRIMVQLFEYFLPYTKSQTQIYNFMVANTSVFGEMSTTKNIGVLAKWPSRNFRSVLFNDGRMSWFTFYNGYLGLFWNIIYIITFHISRSNQYIYRPHRECEGR